MKKIISLVLVIVLLAAALCSCGKTDERIDGKTFDFSYAQDSLHVLYCSAENAEKFPNAKILEYTLTAADGVLTFSGSDGDKTGTYEIQDIGKNYVIYKFNIGGAESLVSFVVNEADDKGKSYTIIWAKGGYISEFVCE
jgi:uncharacterized protein YxeA